MCAALIRYYGTSHIEQQPKINQCRYKAALMKAVPLCKYKHLHGHSNCCAMAASPGQTHMSMWVAPFWYNDRGVWQ